MCIKPETIFHCTTEAKAKRYKETGHICLPVRGFSSIEGAMAWCIKVGRRVILEVEISDIDKLHKLPDHHNKFGIAFWYDENVTTDKYKCVLSGDTV